MQKAGHWSWALLASHLCHDGHDWFHRQDTLSLLFRGFGTGAANVLRHMKVRVRYLGWTVVPSTWIPGERYTFANKQVPVTRPGGERTTRTAWSRHGGTGELELFHLPFSVLRRPHISATNTHPRCRKLGQQARSPVLLEAGCIETAALASNIRHGSVWPHSAGTDGGRRVCQGWR